MNSKKEKEIREQLICAIGDLNEDLLLESAKQLLSQSVSPQQILIYLNMGMKLVGENYESGQYFLGDLIYAGLLYEKILTLPKMQYEKQKESGRIGKVIIGTVAGDVHDLGKSIIANTLSTNGFEVIDLGVDLPTETFVDATLKYKPDIIAVSCVISSSLTEIQKLTDILKNANLRDRVKVIVGGNSSFAKYYKHIGADAYGKDAMEGLAICLSFMESQ